MVCCLITNILQIHRQGVHFSSLQGEPCCEEYTLLDQTVEECEHGLHSILTDSINIPKLGASFEEFNAVVTSVSLGFLNSVPL